MFNPKEHMMSLKGKEYLQVMWRLVWFREEHPDYDILTELVSVTDDSAIFRCRISDANGHPVSSGFGSETKRDFGDFLEKAETKAVGRALAMLGYGTQFAPELEEGERIVDSPVERKPAQTAPQKPLTDSKQFLCEMCGQTWKPYTNKAGEEVSLRMHEEWSKANYRGRVYCPDCIRKMHEKKVSA